MDFFTSFRPANNPNANVISWENLRYLALSSRLLHPNMAGRHINGMLIAAGRAAAFMPKLRGMGIWNGGRRHACVFRYTNIDGKPHISWECTWGLKFQFDPSVINCWAYVPMQGQHSNGNFTASVNPKLMRQCDTKTYASIIRRLRLGGIMQHFISEFQMWSEAYLYQKSSTPV